MSTILTQQTIQAGGIAAGHAATAQAGAQILDAGGSAIDAAVAALIASFIVEPVFSSPGGGGFMTLRSASGETSVLDFFVDLPAHKNSDADIREVIADFGPVQQPFCIGAGTVAVPGMEQALHKLLSHTSPAVTLQQLCATAQRATSDVLLSPLQSRLFEIVAPILTASRQASEIFAPGGSLVKAGDQWRNPTFQHHLQSIAEHGSEALSALFPRSAYLDQQREGGHLDDDDFDRYEVSWRKPVCWRGEKFRAFSNPAPAFGGILALAMLSDLANSSDMPQHRVRAIRSVDQAWRAGKSAAEICAAFGLEHKQTTQAHVKDGLNGTTHISVIDRKGNAVAITVTNGEGNGLIVPGTGYMLNNMLGEEDVNPAGPDGWREQPLGARRLSSMMAPTIVEGRDGQLIALGSGGSNRIRTAIFQVLANRLLLDMKLTEAILLPRIHGEKETLDIEAASEQPGWGALDGHFASMVPWDEQSLYFGGVHAVERDANGRFSGMGDPRREGVFVLVD